MREFNCIISKRVDLGRRTINEMLRSGSWPHLKNFNVIVWFIFNTLHVKKAL